MIKTEDVYDIYSENILDIFTIEIINENHNFKIIDIKKSLIKLFDLENTNRVTLNIDYGRVICTITDIYKEPFNRTKVPYNIKNRTTLGHFDENFNLMILPIENNNLSIRKKTGTNKPIRPLYGKTKRILK